VVEAGVDTYWGEGRRTLAVVASVEVGEQDQVGTEVAHEVVGPMRQGQGEGRWL
jgi:hypothetical protein